jgi:hypothetical protein
VKGGKHVGQELYFLWKLVESLGLVCTASRATRNDERGRRIETWASGKQLGIARNDHLRSRDS